MVGQFTLKSRWGGGCTCTELRVFWGVAGHYPYFMPSIFSRPIQVAIYSPGFTQNWPSWMYIGQSGPSTTIKATIPWWKRYQSFGEEWIQNSWQYVLGGREGGFVNRLIGAIFASLVCHSTFTRCVTKSRFQTSGALRGPGAISREVGAAWATGLWSPVTGLGQRGICGGGGPNGRCTWCPAVWWPGGKQT